MLPNSISSVPSAPASIDSEAPSSARVENSVMQVRGVGARNPAQARTVHDPEASLNPALENRKKFAKFMKGNKLKPEQLVPWLKTYLEDVLSKIVPSDQLAAMETDLAWAKCIDLFDSLFRCMDKYGVFLKNMCSYARVSNDVNPTDVPDVVPYEISFIMGCFEMGSNCPMLFLSNFIDHSLGPDIDQPGKVVHSLMWNVFYVYALVPIGVSFC